MLRIRCVDRQNKRHLGLGHAETHPTLSRVAAFVRFPECQNCEQGEMIWKEVTWINKRKRVDYLLTEDYSLAKNK